MKEFIDWDAVIDELYACISNEQAFANGSSPCERAMHEGNILRMEAEIECIKNGNYEEVLNYYDKSFFEDFVKKTQWDVVYEIKKDLVNKIVEAIGERTIDVNEDNINVSAVEHHCGEGYSDRLTCISASGFETRTGCGFAPWRDMIVEDLAMVLDYLRTGYW